MLNRNPFLRLKILAYICVAFLVIIVGAAIIYNARIQTCMSTCPSAELIGKAEHNICISYCKDRGKVSEFRKKWETCKELCGCETTEFCYECVNKCFH